MSLDERLREILSNLGSVETGDPSDDEWKIAQIKEVFKAEGYIRPVDMPKGIYKFDGKYFTLFASDESMTGLLN